MLVRLIALVLALAVLGGLYVLLAPKEFVVKADFPPPPDVVAEAAPEVPATELATFGSGCFWCTEAVFEAIAGVKRVESGYSGGANPNPTYREVCGGTTGHAEVVQLEFDPRVVKYEELLQVFWQSHDPTTLNRQGADVGTQYRSVVFAHSPRQADLAREYKAKIEAAKVYDAPVVTEIAEFTAFYPAESDHQDFFAANPNQGYCRAVIAPKLKKLKEVFADKLKPGAK